MYHDLTVDPKMVIDEL